MSQKKFQGNDEMGASITLCMIVKNEAANLPRCLSSVQGVVDEILLMDTGSTDDTCKIAEGFGALIHHIPWQNDFSAARNAGIQRASSEWIFIMDADEELETGSRSRFRLLTRQPKVDGYFFIQRNLQPPDELAPWLDMTTIRLFRRLPDVGYEGAVHEQISPSLLRAGATIVKSNLMLFHYGYLQKEAQGLSRAQRNLDLVKQSLKSSPDDPYLLYQLGATLKSLNRNDEARLWLEKALKNSDSLSADAKANASMKLGQIYLALDDNKAALRNASACLQIEPDNLLALYTAGLALFSQGNTSEAYRYFEKITHQPGLSQKDLVNIQQVLNAIEASLKA